MIFQFEGGCDFLLRQLPCENYWMEGRNGESGVKREEEETNAMESLGNGQEKKEPFNNETISFLIVCWFKISRKVGRGGWGGLGADVVDHGTGFTCSFSVCFGRKKITPGFHVKMSSHPTNQCKPLQSAASGRIWHIWNSNY